MFDHSVAIILIFSLEPIDDKSRIKSKTMLFIWQDSLITADKTETNLRSRTGFYGSIQKLT